MSSLAVSIPDGWTWKTVGEFTIEHKQGYYTKESYVSNGISLIRITDLGNPKIEYSNMPKIEIEDKEFNQFKVSVGDFLFARSGAIGRYGIVTSDVPAIFASYLIRFRFNDQQVITRYFGYLYESDLCQKQLGSITQGSSNININAENIKSLFIPFAPLLEQKKIATILTSVDEVIESTQAQINKLKDLKTGMMQELLTKGIGRDGLPHTEFKDSPVGSIPKEWSIRTLGELAEFKSGYAFKSSELSEEGIKIVRISNLHKPDFPYWHYSGLIKDSWIVRSGDILFSWAGVANSINVHKYEGETALINQHIFNFIFGDEVTKAWVYQILKSLLPELKQNIEGGAGQLHLTKGFIQAIPIPFPPDEERKMILKSFVSIDEKIHCLRKKEKNIIDVKKALMQDLLTGKVRVKVN